MTDHGQGASPGMAQELAGQAREERSRRDLRRLLRSQMTEVIEPRTPSTVAGEVHRDQAEQTRLRSHITAREVVLRRDRLVPLARTGPVLT